MVSFYTKAISSHKKNASIIHKKLLNIVILRCLIFCSTIACVYFFWGNLKLVFVSSSIGVGVFVYVLNIHFNLKKSQKKQNELILINTEEIATLHGDFTSINCGEQFIKTCHHYSDDIDLYGTNSLFQRLNRTVTYEGRLHLATLLEKNCIRELETKQQVVKELAKRVVWRQQFAVEARLESSEIIAENFLKWAENYKRILPLWSKVLAKLYSIVTIGIVFGICIDLMKLFHLIIWLLIGFLISVFFWRKVNKVTKKISNITSLFRVYYKLLELIESVSFDTEYLIQRRRKLLDKGNNTPSKIFRQFSKTLDAFDHRNNLLFAFISNRLFLWDLCQVSKIESWIMDNKSMLRSWFDEVHYFDTQNSLANFSFNYPEYVYPVLKESSTIIKAEQLGHPLLDTNRNITNDFKANLKTQIILTGSNMAGKSTFLRTVGLSIVMANTGLPVCASKFIYTPIKLITSMRTIDNLSTGSSYFFSELKRLQFVINEVKKDNYFILLDEILKGTNSDDKVEGSIKFLQKLLILNTTSMIATHDLSLCSLATENSRVRNLYFDAQIRNDQLFFDYKLKAGISKNRNATFLLKKMNIT